MGHDNKILLGAFLELLLIIANIGTAVVIYPLLKRVNEVCAIAYATARLVECTFILVGILTMVAVVTLQRNPSAGSEATLGSIAYTLAAIKDWTFLFGPGFVVGIGNGLLLGYLMYDPEELGSGRMAMLGLIAGPLIIISGIAVMFGVAQQGGPLQGIATIPEFIWELSLGIYPLVWGFKADAPILSGTEPRQPSRCSRNDGSRTWLSHVSWCSSLVATGSINDLGAGFHHPYLLTLSPPLRAWWAWVVVWCYP